MKKIPLLTLSTLISFHLINGMMGKVIPRMVVPARKYLHQVAPPFAVVKKKKMVGTIFPGFFTATHQKSIIVPVRYFPANEQGYFERKPVTDVRTIITMARWFSLANRSLVLLSHGTAGKTLTNIAREHLDQRFLFSEKTVQENPDLYMKYNHLCNAARYFTQMRNVPVGSIETAQVEEESEEGGFNFYDEIAIKLPETTDSSAIDDLVNNGISVAYVGNVKLK